MDKERQIVIVGVGRCTLRANSLEDSLPPPKLLHRAARLAAEDAGLPASILHDVKVVATVDMFYEDRWKNRFGDRPYKNFPRTVADEIGAKSVLDEHCWRSYPGGNGPQYLVNKIGDLLSRADDSLPRGPILIGGVETNHSFDTVARAGKHEELRSREGWCDSEEFRNSAATPVGVNKPRNLAEILPMIVHQFAHGLYTPINIYALLENVYRRRHYGAIDKDAQNAHNRRLAHMFAGFSAVAAQHPEHSWFTNARTVDEIVSASPKNRMMAYPYRKNIVARDEVNQAACLLVMSWAEAERRGVPKHKLVFLVGSGEAQDTEIPIRLDLSQSHYMRAAYEEALRSANVVPAPPGSTKGPNLDMYDIYSCFPIAVEQACDILGIDPFTFPAERMTATGGLPYHGGPGSNYVAHSIAAVVEGIRSQAANSPSPVKGMVCANGGFLTKHAVGIYSSHPLESRTFERREPEDYVDRSGDLGIDAYTYEPYGTGRIIGWTVEYASRPNTPLRGLIVGEIVECGEGEDGETCDVGQRFVATTAENDTATMEWLLEKCRIGEMVAVRTEEEPAHFGDFETTKCTFTRCSATGSAAPSQRSSL